MQKFPHSFPSLNSDGLLCLVMTLLLLDETNKDAFIINCTSVRPSRMEDENLCEPRTDTRTSTVRLIHLYVIDGAYSFDKWSDDRYQIREEREDKLRGF